LTNDTDRAVSVNGPGGILTGKRHRKDHGHQMCMVRACTPESPAFRHAGVVRSRQYKREQHVWFVARTGGHLTTLW
jgi:hypothetical protein